MVSASSTTEKPQYFRPSEAVGVNKDSVIKLGHTSRCYRLTVSPSTAARKKSEKDDLDRGLEPSVGQYSWRIRGQTKCN